MNDKDIPLYMIGVAAALAGLHPQTLRIYENKGLVSPQRTRGNTRLYSQSDIEKLELINELTEDGVNLAGVTRILSLNETASSLTKENELLRDKNKRLTKRLLELDDIIKELYQEKAENDDKSKQATSSETTNNTQSNDKRNDKQCCDAESGSDSAACRVDDKQKVQQEAKKNAEQKEQQSNECCECEADSETTAESKAQENANVETKAESTDDNQVAATEDNKNDKQPITKQMKREIIVFRDPFIPFSSRAMIVYKK